MKLDKLDFKNPAEEWIVGFALTDGNGKQTSFFGKINLPLGYEEAANALYRCRLNREYDEQLPGSCLTEILASPSENGLLEFKLKVLVPKLEKNNPWRFFVPFASEYRPMREEVVDPGIVGVTTRAYLNQFEMVDIVPDEGKEIKNGGYVIGTKWALSPSKKNVPIVGQLRIGN